MSSPWALEPHEIISLFCSGSHSAFLSALSQPQVLGEKIRSNFCLQRWEKENFTANTRTRWRLWSYNIKSFLLFHCTTLKLRMDQSGFLQTMTAKCDCEALTNFFFIFFFNFRVRGPRGETRETSTFGREKHKANTVRGANTWLVVLSLNHERHQCPFWHHNGLIPTWCAFPYTLWAKQAEEANHRLVPVELTQCWMLISWQMCEKNTLSCF